MYARAEKSKENKSRTVANVVVQKNVGKEGFRIVDNRPEALAQRKLHLVVGSNSPLKQLKSKALQLNGYPNKMPNQFGDEITEANNAAFETEYTTGPGPYVQETEGFLNFINSGKEFKWIYGKKNGLVIISPTLKHAVAAGGADVITAGHGQLKSKGNIWINNDTGHYQTSVESLDSSISEWDSVGYKVETRERIDFTAVLGNLGGGNRKRFWFF